jgi:hypothetical protein
MLNNKIIDHRPELAIPIAEYDEQVAYSSNPVVKFTIDAVDFALKKHLPEEERIQVKYGYRRSPFNEESLKVDIDKLNSEEHIVPKDEHYEKALKHLLMLITPPKPLKPVHFADLRSYKWRLSTNIGAPYNSSKAWIDYVKAKFAYFNDGKPFENIAHRDLFKEAHPSSEPLSIHNDRMTKHNLYTEAFYISRKHIHLIKDGHKYDSKGRDLRFWNTAFARQHLVKANDPDKVRLVFGAPFTLLTAELMFIWPLQVHLLNMRGRNSFMLWGFETILGGWYRLQGFFATHAPRHGTVVTLDWSGFDRYARHSVIRDIHQKVLRPIFTFEEGYHPTHRYPHYPQPHLNSQRLENLWNWMTDSVLSIPLLMPNGTMIRFSHSGIFSGYFQTQILDSLYNMVKFSQS